MSNKKQTAVEWLFDNLNLCFDKFDNGEYSYTEFVNASKEIKEQAKAMEKEQMIDFGFDTYCFISGIMKVPFEQLSENRLNAEHNYKETYEQ